MSAVMRLLTGGAGDPAADLMADPEPGLQGILMIAAVVGRPRTAAYVTRVAALSIAAGLLQGAWVDGVNPACLSLGLAAFAALLAATLAALQHRQQRVIQAL